MKTSLTNENYCCEIIELPVIETVEGFDNLGAVYLYGYTALVPKTMNPGEKCLFFTAESQISEKFCHENNLFRDNNLNKNTEEKGYFEPTRRVKALKMKGVISSALILPADSLPEAKDLPIGTRFNYISGHELVKKYQVPQNSSGLGGKSRKGKGTKVLRATTEHFPKHFDTSNYHKNKKFLPEVGTYYVSQKLHGTSARFGNVKVSKAARIRDRIASFFGVSVESKEYKFIAGSRKVDFLPNIGKVPKWHSDESGNVWEYWRKKLVGKIPKDFIVYGEIVGYYGKKEIQAGFDYGFKPGESGFFVYRVVHITDNGLAIDLSWDQVTQFCSHNGLSIVPTITCPEANLEWIEMFMDSRSDTRLNDYYPGFLPVKKVDEGFCVRVDGYPGPLVLKYKFPKFLAYETGQLDKGIVDIESLEV